MSICQQSRLRGDHGGRSSEARYRMGFNQIAEGAGLAAAGRSGGRGLPPLVPCHYSRWMKRGAATGETRSANR